MVLSSTGRMVKRFKGPAPAPTAASAESGKGVGDVGAARPGSVPHKVSRRSDGTCVIVK